MCTAPALRESLGPRSRQVPEACITRSSAHESEATDQQGPITIKAVRRAGDTIDEIQPPLDRCLAAGDLVWYFGHWQSSSRRRTAKSDTGVPPVNHAPDARATLKRNQLKLLTPLKKSYIQCPQF